MKPLFSLLFAVFVSTLFAAAQSQPIYRLKHLLIKEYNGVQYQPYLEFYFSYSGNRQGIAPGADWIEDMLIYSGYVDSVLKPIQGMQYDSAHTYIYNKHSNEKSNVNIVEQLFDAGSNFQYRKKMEWNSFKKDWKLSDSDGYVYTNGNLLKIVGKQNDSTIFHYDAQGRRDTEKHFLAGMIDRLQWWKYDGAGNIAETNEDANRVYYYYDNNNRLTETYVMRAQNDTARANYYTYDTNGDLVEHLQLVSFTGQPLINNNKEYFTYNNHKRTNTLRLYHNSVDPTIWDNLSRIYYDYNSFGLIEKETEQLWNEDKNAWDDYNGAAKATSMLFDYELAWPLHVAHQSTRELSINLYPNPAVGIITIQMDFDDPQPFTATILNMQGGVLMQWNEAATPQYNRIVPTAGMAPGNYILKVASAGLEKTQLFGVQ